MAKSSRKGIIPKEKPEEKQVFTINTEIPETHFAHCECTVNGSIKKNIVTSGQQDDIIQKVKKQLLTKEKIKSIEVRVIKLHKKIL